MRKVKRNLFGIIFMFVFMCIPLLTSIKAYAYSASSNKLNTNYTLTGDGAEDIYAVAKAQLNKKYPEFAGFTYRAWCADFVSACAAAANASDVVPGAAAVANLRTNIVKAGGIEYSKAQIQNGNYTPVRGDIIIFKSNGDSHVGIVDKAESGKIYYIDGNNTVYGNGNNASVHYSNRAYSYAGFTCVVKPRYKTSYIDDPDVVNWYYDGATDHSDFRPVIKVSNPETVSYVHFYVKYTGNEWKRYNGNFNGGNAWYCDVLSSDLGEGGTTIECAAYIQGKNGNTAKGYPYVPLLLEKDDTSHDPFGWVDEVAADEGKIHIRGWVYDPDATDDSLRIHIYIGGKAGENTADGYDCGETNFVRPDVNERYAISGVHGFEYDIYTNLTGNQPIYIYAINKGKGRNAEVGHSIVNIPKDIVKPEIINVEIRDKSPSGYTVSCTVTDNVKVDRVQFPTWTQNNGQDDIFAEWDKQGTSSGNRNGNVYTYRVDVSSHNGETGKYNTHIYAFDVAGNCTEVQLNDIDLFSLHEYEHNPRLIEKKDATCIENGLKIYTCDICGDVKTEEINIDKLNHTNNSEIRNGKEATCAQEGYTGDTYCKDCNAKLLSGKIIPKKEHSWNAGEITKAATCTETGVKTYTCTVCGEIKTEEIPATGNHEHTELRGAKTATCIKEGYSGDIYCKDCGTLISVGSIISKKEHVWWRSKVTQEPTCTTPGIETYTCAECLGTKTEEISATGNHEHTELRGAKEATCSESGYTGDLYCKDCGTKLETGSVIAQKEHAWDSGVVTVPPTCVRRGEKTYTCKVCHATKIQLGKEGANKNLHAWNTGEITKAATCTEAGVKTYTCTLCGETKTEEIPATGNHEHTELRDAKEATCTEAGYTGDLYCKDCGTKLETGTAIPQKEHSWNAGEVTKSETCIESGVKTYTCTLCGEIKTEEIPATGNHEHTELRDVREATCDEAGYTGDLYCKDCGTKLETGKSITKKAHTWDAGMITTPATCTEKGVETYTCTSCGGTKTKELPSTGHVNKEVRNKKVATCMQGGYTGDTYCVDCGTKLSTGKKTAKLAHKWDAGEVTTKATCTETGIKTYTCTVCESTKIEELPATGHGETVTKFAKQATCKIEGYTGDIFCSDCGELLEEGSVIPKTPHQWDAGKITKKATTTTTGIRTYTCTKCKATKKETIPKVVPKKATPGKMVKDTATNGVYKVLTDGLTVTFVRPLEKKATVRIPDTMKVSGVTCKVTEISANAFKNDAVLKNVIVGKNVKKIGANAFYGCKKLIKVSGAAAVVQIGDRAFSNCTALPAVILPSTVTSIGKQAFYNCKKLSSITLYTLSLTSKNVGVQAFTGTYAKAVVKVPAKKLAAYKAILRTKGMSAKAVYRKN